jgi:hypothetical protein
MFIEWISRSDKPVFLTVTILFKDTPPTGREPELTDIGETEILGGGACPESFTFIAGFSISSDEILIIALFLPNGSIGVNVTVTGHELFAGIVEQVFV